MTNIKHVSFGKVAFSGKPKEMKKLEDLQKKKVMLSKSRKGENAKDEIEKLDMKIAEALHEVNSKQFLKRNESSKNK